MAPKRAKQWFLEAFFREHSIHRYFGLPISIKSDGSVRSRSSATFRLEMLFSALEHSVNGSDWSVEPVVWSLW